MPLEANTFFLLGSQIFSRFEADPVKQKLTSGRSTFWGKYSAGRKMYMISVHFVDHFSGLFQVANVNYYVKGISGIVKGVPFCLKKYLHLKQIETE